jgi:hypothetical protein
MREYDPQKDNYYSPDDTPNLYLTNKQIKSHLEDIPKFDKCDEKEVRKVIIKIEILNKREKMGKISTNECHKKIEELNDKFLNKYDYWPYMTKTYELFYKSFIK